MANCRCNAGCIICWAIVCCSIVLVVILRFQGEYVIPTDEYRTCEKLLTFIFIFITLFAVVIVIFIKTRVTDGSMPILAFIFSAVLILFSILIIFQLETVTIPTVDEAITIVRQRYATDPNVLAFIQTKHKCCGLRNYTDWGFLVLDHERERQEKMLENNETGQQIANIPIVVSSCCKLVDHCGVHLYIRSQRGKNDKDLESNNNNNNNRSNSTAVPTLQSKYEYIYINQLDDYIYTRGCYQFLKKYTQTAYESMKAYTFFAFFFVVTATLSFTYYWWKRRREDQGVRTWPAPPMTVETVMVDSQKGQRGYMVAYINPFLDSVIDSPIEVDDDDDNDDDDDEEGTTTDTTTTTTTTNTNASTAKEEATTRSEPFSSISNNNRHQNKYHRKGNANKRTKSVSYTRLKTTENSTSNNNNHSNINSRSRSAENPRTGFFY